MTNIIPEPRNILESTFNKEFTLACYDPENDDQKLQADSTSWDKMIAFATSLADDPDHWYRHLWTSTDEGESGTFILNNGTRFVNRMDYWFTNEPWGCGDKEIDDQTFITVAWEDQEGDDWE